MTLKLCLAGSGGGHVRQLLDLEGVWRQYPYFFVTEDTALGRSLSAQHPVEFVAHYAVGQARLGQPLKFVAGAIRNFFQSIAIVVRERPDVVISSGAGAVFWVAVLARLLGARLIIIESFARFDHPSKFGRIAEMFAHEKIVQAPALKAVWPDAQLFDPLRTLEGTPPPKKKLLFATVGATLPFERLVDTVLALKKSGKLDHEVILQTGDDPRPLEAVLGVRQVASLDFAEVRQILQDAEFVVCHGGTGSLITALREGCHVIAMPRKFSLGEHYDDHQEEITSAFQARGLISIADDPDGLNAAIHSVQGTQPVMATTDHSALMGWLGGYLKGFEEKRRW